MMKKYMAMMVGVFLTAGLLTGCGESVPDLTEEQQTEVTEYAVGTLLKYSQYSNSRLTEKAPESAGEFSEEPPLPQPDEQEDPVREEEQPWLEEPAAEEPEETQKPVYSTISMNEFMGLQGVSLRYAGYQVTDSYPSDSVNSYFSMTAAEGKTLLVLEFELKNEGNASAAIDLNRTEVNFSYSDNGGQKYKLQHTMVENDIYGFSGSLEPGETKTIAGIVEVPAGEAESISVPALTMAKGEEKETILLR